MSCNSCQLGKQWVWHKNRALQLSRTGVKWGNSQLRPATWEGCLQISHSSFLSSGITAFEDYEAFSFVVLCFPETRLHYVA